MTTVYYASTLFGAMTLAAADDAGLLGERAEPRLLIVAATTPAPEINTALDEQAAFDPLRERFDRVVRWNDIIAPLHPSRWTPREVETPMLARLIGRELGLPDGARELVVESIAVPPARTLGVLIRECPITVYSDGLMSYAPTRDELPIDIGRRAERLLHLDLVPTVQPLLLREIDAVAVPIPDAAFLKVLAQLAQPAVGDAAGIPLVIGQYLADLEILTPAEEARLHGDMIRALAARGNRTVAFKPHPAAGAAQLHAVSGAARRAGVRIVPVVDGQPAEAWFAAARPELVVSCFSTALFTATHHFGLPVATVGTELVLSRLTPYQNSNRVPLTLADAALPRLQADGSMTRPEPLDLDHLLRAVGYCMQPTRNPELLEDAAGYLAAHGTERYFVKRRLSRVGLAPPPMYRRSVTVRRAIRAIRAGRRVAEIAQAQRPASSR